MSWPGHRRAARRRVWGPRGRAARSSAARSYDEQRRAGGSATLSWLRDARLNPDPHIDLEAQPAQKADGLAGLEVDAEVAQQLEHHAVRVAEGDVVVVVQGGIALGRGVDGHLDGGEEFDRLLGVDPVTKSGREGELTGVGEILFQAEAQADQDVPAIGDAERRLDIEKA